MRDEPGDARGTCDRRRSLAAPELVDRSPLRSAGDGRRSIHQLSAARMVPAPLPGAGSAPRSSRRNRLRVAVVGAGAFGGWTALQLVRRGIEVVLVDAWGAGNSRSSSGGETRVIRGIYGGDALYTDWVVRSFELWREAEREWDERLVHSTGLLWMFRGDDGYARRSLPLLAERGLAVEELAVEAAGRRFPQVDFDGVRSVFVESEGGFLAARRSCRRTAGAVGALGGEVRIAHAEPGPVADGEMAPLRLAGGSTLAADRYVFAGGPWLGRLFPEVLGPAILPTRQEVCFFGPPPGEERFGDDRFPAWVDWGDRVVYGVPATAGRGFKVADDTRGEPVDPTTMERTLGEAAVARARRFLAERFPPLAGAPLVEGRVCQYENSPDGDLVLDRHPQAGNAWIAGGGSGHGFKLAPAVGEHVARLVLGETEPLPRFSIGRLAAAGKARRTQWEEPGAWRP